MGDARDLRLAVLIAGKEKGLQPVKHRAFLHALRQHFPGLEVWNIEPTLAESLAARLRTFHPKVGLWRRRFKSHPLTFLAKSRALARLWRGAKPKPDVLLMIGAVSPALAGVTAPVVVYTDYATVLTSRLGREYRLDLPPEVARERVGQEAEVLRAVAHVCTRSGFVADAIRDDYGVAAERISVVGGGCNLPIGLPVRRPGGPVNFLFIGREFQRKGGDIVLTAFRELRSRRQDVRLHIVAPRALHRPEEGITWYDGLHERALAGLFQQVDVFVLASRFETWGDVLVEAMTAGAACIAPAAAPMDEILDHGAAGMLFAPGDPWALADAMELVAMDAGLRARLSAAAQARAGSDLNWPAVAARLAQQIQLAAGA